MLALKPRLPNHLTNYNPRSLNNSSNYNLHCIIDKL